MTSQVARAAESWVRDLIAYQSSRIEGALTHMLERRQVDETTRIVAHVHRPDYIEIRTGDVVIWCGEWTWRGTSRVWMEWWR